LTYLILAKKYAHILKLYNVKAKKYLDIGCGN
jgi:hypothetical protein